MAGDILKKLRTGTPLHKKVTLGNGDHSVSIAVVVISVDAIRSIEEKVESYCQENANKVNEKIRVQYYNQLLAAECMRNPENLNEYLVDEEEEVGELLDLEDISRVCGAYSELMINKAPKIELLTQENLDELKKHLEVTSLSDLSTVSLIHLRNFHQTIVSEN